MSVRPEISIASYPAHCWQLLLGRPSVESGPPAALVTSLCKMSQAGVIRRSSGPSTAQLASGQPALCVHLLVRDLCMADVLPPCVLVKCSCKR